MIHLITKKTLTLEAAKCLIDFAIQKALELKVGGAVAVVDDGGHLICLNRIDGTMAAAANITIGKAATAVQFKRPGLALEKTISTTRVSMQTLGNVTPLPYVPLMGAYPIIIDGDLVGGVAVGGAENGDNDETIVKFALEQFLRLLEKK